VVIKTCLRRKFEDKLAALYIQQKHRFHLYNGQEAVLAEHYMLWILQDKMITAYRNSLPSVIGMGCIPGRVMANSKATGTRMGTDAYFFLKNTALYGGWNS
jgi:TPP-dependent pyruvate/acetoin dehydrogenase alpha subunit